MIGEVSVAAATAVAGYDLARNETWRVAAKRRRLHGVAVCGSAAAGDCSFDLMIDQYKVGRFYVLATGWPTRDHVVPLKGNLVPPGSTISLIMNTAPTTNPINVILY